jgi:hypothetical protein
LKNLLTIVVCVGLLSAAALGGYWWLNYGAREPRLIAACERKAINGLVSPSTTKFIRAEVQFLAGEQRYAVAQAKQALREMEEAKKRSAALVEKTNKAWKDADKDAQDGLKLAAKAKSAAEIQEIGRQKVHAMQAALDDYGKALGLDERAEELRKWRDGELYKLLKDGKSEIRLPVDSENRAGGLVRSTVTCSFEDVLETKQAVNSVDLIGIDSR